MDRNVQLLIVKAPNFSQQNYRGLGVLIRIVLNTVSATLNIGRSTVERLHFELWSQTDWNKELIFDRVGAALIPQM